MLLFRNEAKGRFAEVGGQAGPAFAERRVWRGIAVGDVDGDGAPDLLISTCGGRPALLRNECRRRSAGGLGNHWLKVRLVGRKSNRDGIGGRVVVEAGGVRQQRWVRSGSSYASASELCAFFGLGHAAIAERVQVRWPSGILQQLRRVPADRALVLHERPGDGP